MFRYGAELGWLAAADLPRIRKYRLRLGAYRWLRTEPEIRRLLAAAREEGANVLALYATAVYTGMRAGELAGLRWGHVDLDRRLITVTSSYDGPTKGGETRHVPILDPLLPILRAWALRSAGELVFAHQNGTMLRRDSRLFQETLKRVLERAQLPRRCIVFHSLRHTFASHWAMRGGDRRRRRPGSRREGAHEPKAA
jgi:integrase